MQCGRASVILLFNPKYGRRGEENTLQEKKHAQETRRATLTLRSRIAWWGESFRYASSRTSLDCERWMATVHSCGHVVAFRWWGMPLRLGSQFLSVPFVRTFELQKNGEHPRQPRWNARLGWYRESCTALCAVLNAPFRRVYRLCSSSRTSEGFHAQPRRTGL